MANEQVKGDERKAKRGKHRAFVSHSSKDHAQAAGLCELLESHGIGSWIAPRDVQPGEPYGAQIVHAIEECSSCILILSANSNASRHVESEIARAFEKGKAIFPVRLEEVQPSAELELFIASPHWIEAWQWGLETAAERLTRAIHAGHRQTVRKKTTERSSSCLFSGCLTVVLLTCAVAAGFFFAYRTADDRRKALEEIRRMCDRGRSRLRGEAPHTVGTTQAVPAAPEKLTVPPSEPAAGPAVPFWKPQASVRLIPETGMEFVWILPAGVWVGRYETTNEQFRRFRPDHWSGLFRGENLDGPSLPAVRVSYGDATDFAKWLTGRERAAGRLVDGAVFRLPSAEEWSTIAACGDSRAYPWGNAWPPEHGNFADRSVSRLGWGWSYLRDYNDGHGVSCPVSESGQNPWGLFGVAGNVWEWTSEQRGAEYAARGGAWDSNTREFMLCRTRASFPASHQAQTLGFRLVLTAPAPQ